MSEPIRPIDFNGHVPGEDPATPDLSWIDEAQAVMDAVESCPTGRCYWHKPPGLKVPILYPCGQHDSPANPPEHSADWYAGYDAALRYAIKTAAECDFGPALAKLNALVERRAS